MRRFSQFAAIDWSGAAVERPAGIAVGLIDHDGPPQLLKPRPRWSRADVLTWLLEQADRQADILIGFDMSFALPFLDAGAYFPGWSESPPNARELWTMVERISAGDPHLGVGSFVGHPQARRHFRHGKGDVGDHFTGGTGRLRNVEQHQRATGQCSSASCFNLVGAAQVGKASLSGMRLLHRLEGRIPAWPFDPVPRHGPLIVEIYTTIAARAAAIPPGRSKIRDRATLKAALATLNAACPARLAGYDDHSTDALLTAAWLRHVHDNPALWSPRALTAAIAAKEGWTFGIV